MCVLDDAENKMDLHDSIRVFDKKCPISHQSVGASTQNLYVSECCAYHLDTTKRLSLWLEASKMTKNARLISVEKSLAPKLGNY